MMPKLTGIVTLDSLVNTLAYIHYYTIPYLRTRGCPAPHLQALSAWIGLPKLKLVTLRKHRLLMAHLSLLLAADLLEHTDSDWVCSPLLETWLSKPSAAQYQHLINSIDGCAWRSTLEKENWLECFDSHYANDLRLTLQNQFDFRSSYTAPSAVWVEVSDKCWRVALPFGLAPKIRFHLLQLGQWQPGQSLNISPMTIAKASLCGYGYHFIQYLLTEATQTQLTSTQNDTLWEWLMAAEHYQMRDVALLSTAHSCQLDEIMAYQRLSHHIQTQLSPRHAIVSPQLYQPLRKWLLKKSKVLKTTTFDNALQNSTAHHQAVGWIGLAVLVELKKLLPLSITLPKHAVEAEASLLNPSQHKAYQGVVDDIVAAIKQAIQGNDAFFPAAHPVSELLIQQISMAIDHEKTILISYQALSDVKPSYRTIDPLRLEKRGALFYLQAYCHRAEMNLTFRLDRITKVEEGREA